MTRRTRENPSNDRPETGDDGTARRVRIQRVLADAGVAARRVCEQMIEDGHVRVNGTTVTRLPIFVDPEVDRIEVDGRPLRKPERHLYLMLHKPPRTLATTKDEEAAGRATVMAFVDHPAQARLFPVGRLDYDTSGLLLVTNDGAFAHQLTHPKFQIPKTYLATIRGRVDQAHLADVWKKLRALDRQEEREQGVSRRMSRAAAQVDEKVRAALRGREPVRPRFDILSTDAEKSMVRFTLAEGKHKQLAEAMRILGTPVKKIVRVAFGPVVLRGLAPARWRELTREEMQALKKAVAGKGPKEPDWSEIDAWRERANERSRQGAPGGEKSSPAPSRDRGTRFGGPKSRFQNSKTHGLEARATSSEAGTKRPRRPRQEAFDA